MATSCMHGSGGARRAPLRPSKPAQNAQARGRRPVSAQRFRKSQPVTSDRPQPAAQPLRPLVPRGRIGSTPPHYPGKGSHLSSRPWPSSASNCPEPCRRDPLREDEPDSVAAQVLGDDVYEGESVPDDPDLTISDVFDAFRLNIDLLCVDDLPPSSMPRNQDAGEEGNTDLLRPRNQDARVQGNSDLLRPHNQDAGEKGNRDLLRPRCQYAGEQDNTDHDQGSMDSLKHCNQDAVGQEPFHEITQKANRRCGPRPASAPTGRTKANSQKCKQALQGRPASAGCGRDLEGLANQWRAQQVQQVVAPVSVNLRHAHKGRPPLPASVKRLPSSCSRKWVELLEEFSHQVDLRAMEDGSAPAIVPSGSPVGSGDECQQTGEETLSIPPAASAPDSTIENVRGLPPHCQLAGSNTQEDLSNAGTSDVIWGDPVDSEETLHGDVPEGLPHNWWCQDASSHAASEADARARKQDKREKHELRADSMAAWLSVYGKFAHDGEVHRDSLTQVLTLGGVHALSRRWLDDVCDSITKFTTLNPDEFLQLIQLCELKYHEDCVKAFKRFDTDKSGYIDSEELAATLASLNVAPMQQVLREILNEVKDPLRGTDDIDLEQYKELMHLLRKREGFSKEEYDRMLRAFSVFDRDGSDSLDVHELIGVNGYLYYSLSAADVTRILREVDVDGSGSLSRAEFLVYMRKVRELEVMRIEGALSVINKRRKHAEHHRRDSLLTRNETNVRFKKSNSDITKSPSEKLSAVSEMSPSSPRSSKQMRRGRTVASSTLDAQPDHVILKSFFRHLGYATTDQVLEELAEDAGLEHPVEHLSLDSAWHALEMFRSREGFLRVQSADIETAFRLCHESRIWEKDYAKIQGLGHMTTWSFDTPLDIDACEIDTSNACKALRWLGYVSSYQVLQYFVREVDVDESGKLGIEEFKKLVRMYRERELQRLQANLYKHGAFRADRGGKDEISKEACCQALVDLGCWHDHADLDVRSSPLEMFDIHAAVSCAISCRDRVRSTYRENCGFSPEDVKKLREVFKRFDKDNSGTIDHMEVQKLFERMFGGKSSSAAFRPKLLEMIGRAGVGGPSGGLGHFAFLRLVREFHDLNENDRLIAEQGSIMLSQFSSAEVKAFREIFLSMDEDCKDCVSFDQVKEMLARVIPMGDKQSARLRSIWSGKAQQGRDPCNIDFPEFLMLIRRLLEANFGGMKERTMMGPSTVSRTSTRLSVVTSSARDSTRNPMFSQ